MPGCQTNKFERKHDNQKIMFLNPEKNRTLARMCITSFFYKLEAQWADSVSLTFHSALKKLNTEPSIGTSHQISVQLAKQFQRRIFRNQPTRNKNCLWQSCLLTDRDEISNRYREPSIDASYQVSVHLVKWFQRRRFLEIHQSETRMACGGHVC